MANSAQHVTEAADGSYDIFISYRREGGYFQAKTLGEGLRNLYPNLRVFLDLEELPSGRFDDSLLANISSAGAVVLVITPGSLERCANEGDWVCREITCALESGRLLIPVFFDGAEMPDASGLPPSIQGLVTFNGIRYEKEFHAAAIDKLARFVGNRNTLAIRSAFGSPAEREARARDLLDMAIEQANIGNLHKASIFAEQSYALRPSFISSSLSALARALTSTEMADVALLRQHLSQTAKFDEADHSTWFLAVVESCEQAIANATRISVDVLELALRQAIRGVGSSARDFRLVIALPGSFYLKTRIAVSIILAFSLTPLIGLAFAEEAYQLKLAKILLSGAGISVVCIFVLWRTAAICSQLAPTLRWLIEPDLRDRFSVWYADSLVEMADTLFSRANFQNRVEYVSRNVGVVTLHLSLLVYGSIGLFQMTDMRQFGVSGSIALVAQWIPAIILISTTGVMILKYYLIMLGFARWPLKALVSEFEKLQLGRLMNAILLTSILLILVYLSVVLYGYFAFRADAIWLHAAYLSFFSVVGLIYLIGVPYALTRALSRSRAEMLLKVSGVLEEAVLVYVSEAAPEGFDRLRTIRDSESAFSKMLAGCPSAYHLMLVGVMVVGVIAIASAYLYFKFN